MPGRLRPAACVLFLVLCVPSGPVAAAERVFTVEHVAVDETAHDTQEARRIAIVSAQKEAWHRLVRRLVAGDPSPVAEPGAETLVSLVQSLEISGERITVGRYRAFVTVRFRAAAVLDLLESSDVTHLPVPGPVLLVLPVFRTAAGPVLWEQDNAWLTAWQRSGDPGDAVEIEVPVGDLEDLLAIDADDALAGNWPKMQPFLARYHADGILVAHAIPGDAGLVQGLTWYEGPYGETVPVEDVPAPPAGGDDASAGIDLGSAVAAARRAVSEHWTAATFVPDGPESVAVAEIPIRSLAEWVDIRRRLALPAVLTDIVPLAVSLDRVRILMRHVGEPGELRAGLQRFGLDLEIRDGAWIVRVP